MTFYNVISALLFVGCLRILLVALDAARWARATAVACLVVLVFNDMLSTSHRVETTQSLKYTSSLMIVDLFNFVLLALAMIVGSPERNMFDVPLPQIARTLRPSSFWLLLAIYWLLLMVWTRIADQRTVTIVVAWQGSVAAIFLINWLLNVLSLPCVTTIMSAVALGYLIVYITWLRPYVRSLSGLS